MGRAARVRSVAGATTRAAADPVVYLAYTAGWALVRWMPEPVARRLFRWLADLVWRRHGKQVRRLEANLARVRPDADEAALRALSREAMRSYLRYWLEVFRLPTLSREQIVARFEMVNEAHLRALMAEGRGVVAALAHMGNWDLAGAWAALNGLPVVTVAERLRPERLFDRFLAFRESLGMQVLPLTGGGRAIGVLAQRLREGRLVPLLAERDLTARGVPVTFFGETTRMPAGPATLALRTGAPLVAVIIWYDGAMSKAWVSDPVPVPARGERAEQVAAMTQAVADLLAAGIAEHPTDWHMLQRLWLSDLDPERLAASDAATTASAPVGEGL